MAIVNWVAVFDVNAVDEGALHVRFYYINGFGAMIQYWKNKAKWICKENQFCGTIDFMFDDNACVVLGLIKQVLDKYLYISNYFNLYANVLEM